MVEIEKKELEDLEQKATEMNIASEAMLDLIQAIRYKSIVKTKKGEPKFWKDVRPGKNIRISKNH